MNGFVSGLAEDYKYVYERRVRLKAMLAAWREDRLTETPSCEIEYYDAMLKDLTKLVEVIQLAMVDEGIEIPQMRVTVSWE